MTNLRLTGTTSLIVDNKNTISEILLGILIRSAAHGLKIALVDTNNHCSKIIQVLENLSLTKEFKIHFKKIHIETFTKNSKGISRGILPIVEYQTITEEIMYRELYKFDMILIDHPDNSFISNPKTISLLKNKKEETEILVSLEQLNNKISQYIENIYIQKEEKQQSLLSNKTITLITPSPFSNLYSYGRLILEFIKKEQVKYLAFDKADAFYGEHVFFTAIKHWKRSHNLYGEFDYVITGLPRHTGPNLRSESTIADRSEVEECLMLLSTALKKHTPIVIDNIDEAIKHEILTSSEFYKVIEKATKEVLIPTTTLFNELKPIAGKIISFELDKKSPKAKKIKKGIDY